MYARSAGFSVAGRLWLYDEPVTETLPPAGMDLFDVVHIRLAEVEAPPLSPEAESAMDRVWDRAVQANPALFDGPVVACAGLEWTGPRSVRLSWVRVTYRHYALRWVPDGPRPSPRCPPVSCWTCSDGAARSSPAAA